MRYHLIDIYTILFAITIGGLAVMFALIQGV